MAASAFFATAAAASGSVPGSKETVAVGAKSRIAFSGEEGLRLIEKSLLENNPFSLAFVDVGLGSGWDGVETTCKIWQQYPDLNVVLCTGLADRPWEDLVKSLGFLDRIIVLIKPFNIAEVKQLAVGLSEKWRLGQQAKLCVDNLEKLVQNLRARR